jgi:hypothetical protein
MSKDSKTFQRVENASIDEFDLIYVLHLHIDFETHMKGEVIWSFSTA